MNKRSSDIHIGFHMFPLIFFSMLMVVATPSCAMLVAMAFIVRRFMVMMVVIMMVVMVALIFIVGMLMR